MWSNIQTHTKALLAEILRVYLALMRILIPATILVKILDEIGATLWLAKILSPIMGVVGLPEEMGLVWAVALLTNIYTGMVMFYNFALTDTVTVAQISILGSMFLIGHAIPIEGAIAKALGFGWRLTILVRVAGAILFGAVFNLIYTALDFGHQPSTMLWQPHLSTSNSILDWCKDQLTLFASIFIIIAALIIILRILKVLGIEALMHKLLTPLLRGLTLGKEAANITIIGMTLGLTYGAGLLMDEVKQGHISQRDTILVVGFLSICHSIIEDTLLIMLLGADLSAILWGRTIFAILVIGIWGRILKVEKVEQTN